uniref:Protein phosphatase 1 regulatory subunit 12B n=1 Tax=Cyanistes caeruleus TaxID=156563 RepID=A0A8C0ZIX6_CYACU
MAEWCLLGFVTWGCLRLSLCLSPTAAFPSPQQHPAEPRGAGEQEFSVQGLIARGGSEGAVFLAACSSGDTEEVKRLLGRGARINTTNVDGLTALHQACIDENLDMVKFLVENGANVNQQDNEGWTPLHAVASCGYLNIAEFLISHGANVAAVNSEGEVPSDIAEEAAMKDLLLEQVKKQGLPLCPISKWGLSFPFSSL